MFACQGQGDDRTLRPYQAIQASSAALTHLAQPAGPDHPRIRREIEVTPCSRSLRALARPGHSQQQRQRGWKLNSFHGLELACIGKGKAAAPCGFGVKALQRRQQPPCKADGHLGHYMNGRAGDAANVILLAPPSAASLPG